MKYARVITAVANEPWAIMPDKMRALIDFFALQAAGEKFSAEEIEARISKETEKSVARQEGNIAILPLRGVIANRANMLADISGGASSERFGQLFQNAVDDSRIKAVVLDVDSPGGAVAGTPELTRRIFEARGKKPIVAQVNATAASAAYWIASAADEIIVTPSGQVGSVGVFGVHKDMSSALEKLGVKHTLISAGKYKTEGNSFEPLSEEAQKEMQARVDAAYDYFVKDLARNFNVPQKAVREGFGQGRTVDADKAVESGMAHRIGTMEETLKRFGASFSSVEKRRAFAPKRELAALEID